MEFKTKFDSEETRFNTQFSIFGEGGSGGKNGATFIPSVSKEGIISWQNDQGLPNPTPVNIKGEKGDKGDRGLQGERGLQGTQGKQGERGEQGQKGDKGDTGNSGVYLGSGDMPADCNVQIDPDGDVFTADTFANALKGTASGEAIAITDASPIEHEMSVKASGVSDIGTVKVKKYGKNLFEATARKEQRGITFKLLDDGTYHVYGTNDGTGESWCDQSITLPKGIYSGSGCAKGGTSTAYFIQFYNQATKVGKNDYGEGVEFATTATQNVTVHMVVKSGQTVDLIFKPMIEVGAGDKVYEPYIEPIEYPVSVDGTVEGVNPIYPTTTLITDTAGAVIDCTYNRDANKVITDLETKLNTLIATIGG